MRVFTILNLVTIVLMTVAAAAGSGAQNQPGASVPPRVAEPYNGRYMLQIRTNSDQTREYAQRLQNHIVNTFRFRPGPFSEFLPFLDETGLRQNLNFDRSLPRFLYLGHRYWSHPDMVLATPLHLQPRADGSHVWALLTVHPPLWRGGPPQVKARGFITAQYGQAVIRRLSQRGRFRGGSLEPGHILSIEQVFQELRWLRWASWNPGV